MCGWKLVTMQNRSEQSILFVGLMVGVLVIGYVFSLFTAAQQADVQADTNNARLLQNLIRDREANFLQAMSHLVVSDAAFNAVESGKPSKFFSKACAGKNFGSQLAEFGLLRNGKIRFLCAYGRVKRPEEHAYAAEDISTLSEKLIETMAGDQDRYKLVFSEFVHLVDYIMVDGRAYLVLLSPVTPESNREITPDYVPTLAFAMVSVERTIADRYPEKLSLNGFRVVSELESGVTRYASPIKSRTGKPVAYFTWNSSQQFQNLLNRFLPSIAVLTLVSVLLIARYLHRIGKLQKIISAQEAEARHKSLHDALTTLPNRGYFNTAIRDAIAAARADAPCFVGFLDLDQFKQVNDTLGHDAGDALIKEVAHRVRNLLDDSDFLARLGGDEFAFVLSSITSDEQARALCERIITAIKQPFNFAGGIINPSASLGVAECTDSGSNTKTILKAADLALYASKDRGRGCYSFYRDRGMPDIPAAAELSHGSEDRSVRMSAGISAD